MRLTRPRLGRAVTLGLLLAALPAGASGCIVPVPHIVLGQPYTTGNATYDDFFRSVRELHAEAQRAEADERASHAPLISALGLEAKTSAQMAVNETRDRARKLRDGGVLLHLELLPETKVVTKKEARASLLTPSNKDLLKAVEESTKSALAVSQRVGSIATRAAELEKVRVDLRAQAPSTFRAELESKRFEITQELDAAAGVLTESADLGNRYSGLAAKFVLEVARALESGDDDTPEAAPPSKVADTSATSTPSASPAAPPASAAPSAPPAPPPTAEPVAHAPAKKPPSGKPKGGAQKPPPAAKPPPSSGKKPKGGDDFEP